jgi:ABC-type uncharacterized transport system permease subunit
MTPLYLLSSALYGAATVVFAAHIFYRSERMLRLGRWSMAAALAAQLALIGVLCLHGFNPLRDVRGALGLSGWLLGVGYLLTTLRSRFAVIGALVAPASGLLLLASWLLPLGGSPAGMARTLSLLGKLHIALSALGVAAFGLAAAVSIIYLLQEAALKRKRIATLSRRTPALTALDDASRRAILVGFPLFTLAVITGLIWATRIPGEGFRLEHAVSALTWMIFAGLIAARVSVGLRGRSAALLTISGFVATMVVLLIYLSRRLLGA